MSETKQTATRTLTSELNPTTSTIFHVNHVLDSHRVRICTNQQARKGHCCLFVCAAQLWTGRKNGDDELDAPTKKPQCHNATRPNKHSTPTPDLVDAKPINESILRRTTSSCVRGFLLYSLVAFGEFQPIQQGSYGQSQFRTHRIRPQRNSVVKFGEESILKGKALSTCSHERKRKHRSSNGLGENRRHERDEQISSEEAVEEDDEMTYSTGNHTTNRAITPAIEEQQSNKLSTDHQSGGHKKKTNIQNTRPSYLHLGGLLQRTEDMTIKLANITLLGRTTGQRGHRMRLTREQSRTGLPDLPPRSS
jgi:hypothetical protein